MPSSSCATADHYTPAKKQQPKVAGQSEPHPVGAEQVAGLAIHFGVESSAFQ
jgi:hypothetical protein